MEVTGDMANLTTHEQDPDPVESRAPDELAAGTPEARVAEGPTFFAGRCTGVSPGVTTVEKVSRQFG